MVHTQAAQTVSTKRPLQGRVPLSLDQLDAQATEGQAQPTAEQPPEAIDAVLFTRGLDELIASLQQTRPAVAAFMQHKRYHLVHNCWEQLVATHMELNLLQDAREALTDYMRQACKNPTLYIKPVLDESLAPLVSDTAPLSDKEKMTILVNENPHFEMFLDTFMRRK